MSTPLQRLVERARGDQNGHALRIEPLLGPRFAATTPAGVALQESDTEVIAMARGPAGNTPATPASGMVPTPAVRWAAPDDRRVATVPPLKIASLATPPTPATPRDDSHDERPTRSLLDRAVDETTHDEIADASVRQPGTGASPARAAPKYDMDRISAAPAQSVQSVMSQDESPASITISIGHVEVRNAPAPAAAVPRRPAFRPGLSLDAFLQRGKGDRR